MRDRYQRGRVEERGSRRKKWYGHYFVYVMENGVEVRKHRGVVLGAKSELRKWEAQEKLRAIIERETGTVNPIKEAVTFAWFYDNRFEPMRKGKWGDATRRGNASDVRLYLRPELGDRPLGEFDRYQCQTFINALAEKGYSESVVARCKTMLWSVFDIALDLDLIPKNPMAKVSMPTCKATPKPIIDKADVLRLIQSITDVRDRLILLLGVFGGTRSSEAFGIQWGCYKGDHIEIRNTAYRGRLHEWRVKRKASFRRITIPPLIQRAFEQWKAQSPDTSADALVFPSEKTGRPMWPGVFLQKRIQPIAKTLGITVPVTFQVLRRSCTTRNQKNGSLKDVQVHMGHGSIETTGNVYMMEIPDSVAQMVALDVTDVMGSVQ
jgi:integrase